MGGGGRRGREGENGKEGEWGGGGEGGEGKGEDGEKTQNIGNECAAFSNTYMYTLTLPHSLTPSYSHISQGETIAVEC